MKKIADVIIPVIMLILICVIIYWLVWGRILKIDIKTQDLDDVVDTSYFEELYPNMSRTEISEKIGQPTLIDVPYQDEDYVEIRWIYERENGTLSYYVMQEDVPGGSIEYIPNDMYISDFLAVTPEKLFGKRFIEINSGNNHLITIKVKGNKKIKTINWYNKN